MDYLYIYTIDPETKYRHFIFCTARKDDKDEIVRKERSLGAISTTPLHSEEIQIMNGETNMKSRKSYNKFGRELTWYVPYLGDNNEILAIIGFDFSIDGGKYKIFRDFLSDLTFLLSPLLLGMFILLLLFNKRISIPLTTISERMTTFAKDARNKPAPLFINRKDEIGKIAANFDKMTDDISKYINNIEALTQERVENNVQLEVARKIQLGLVPEKSEIDTKFFKVCAITKPAKAVGGDFYDCFKPNENTLCIVIGDVSGKGVSAAIFMAMTKTMIREKLMSGCTPAQALNYANNEICTQNPETLFATVFAAVFDYKKGELQYANAGHTSPVLLKSNPSFLEMDSGIALGLFEDSNLKDYTINLRTDEGILLYTDGISEALDTNNKFFGKERLLETVKSAKLCADNANNTVDTVLQAVQNFSCGTEQFDDTAIMAAYLKSPTDNKSQNLPVDNSAFDIIKKTVFEIAGETPFSRKVMLACDEVLANIVNHSKASHLTFSCEKKDTCFSVIFSDDGLPFDSTAQKNPEKDFDMLDEGGMGLNIIRQTVTTMTYERKDNWNILTLNFDSTDQVPAESHQP